METNNQNNTTETSNKNTTTRGPVSISSQRSINIDVSLTDEQVKVLIEKINEICDGFGSTAVLTPEERKRKVGTGVRNIGFIEKTYDLACTYPELAYFLDMDEFSSVMTNIRNDIQILAHTDVLRQCVYDHMLVSGDRAYRLSLNYYNTIKQLARQGIAQAVVVLEIIEPYFKKRRKPKNGTPPTDQELLRDAGGLLRGTKDGRIVIENENPAILAGTRRVVDHTHQDDNM